MLFMLWEALWLVDAVVFGGLVFLIMTQPRRRGPYEVYEGDTNILVITNNGEEVVALRTLVDVSPKILVQFHYAEDVRNTARFGRQDLYAELEVSDCDVLTLGRARAKTAYRAGENPTWSADRGLVTVVLPANNLDLERIHLKVDLKAPNAFSRGATVVASADVGKLSDVAHGNPVETRLAPQGRLVLSAITTNVNQPPIALARPNPPSDDPEQQQAREDTQQQPVAVARPITPPSLPIS